MSRALWVALACWFAAPVQAATVTLTAPGTSCLYESMAMDAAGNVTVICAKPAPPPVSTLCVVQPVRNDFPKPGSSPAFTSQIGVVNTWKLPASSGLVASTTEYPGTPQSLVVEWAISKCPGDFEYYKTDAAKITTPRGQRVIACGGVGGQSAGVAWGRAGGCVITPGDWYINLRYLSGGSPGASYTITMGLAL